MAAHDKILYEKILRRRLIVWRAIAVFAITALLIFAYAKGNPFKTSAYIAHISISGEIVEDRAVEKKLSAIASDPKVKAVVIRINSPGGTSYGGESLYYSILDIKKNKPVVAVMGTTATSAGYMIALAADHIIARHSTITASIGVVFMSPDFSELTKKLGINFIVIKKGKLKAEPSLFNGNINEDGKLMVNSLLADQYAMFIEMVKKNRKIAPDKFAYVSDGRLLTGSQALQYGLIDQLGGEQEALAWLVSKNVDTKHLPLQPVSLHEDDGAITSFSLRNLKQIISQLKKVLGIFASSSF